MEGEEATTRKIAIAIVLSTFYAAYIEQLCTCSLSAEKSTYIDARNRTKTRRDIGKGEAFVRSMRAWADCRKRGFLQNGEMGKLFAEYQLKYSCQPSMLLSPSVLRRKKGSSRDILPCCRMSRVFHLHHQRLQELNVPSTHWPLNLAIQCTRAIKEYVRMWTRRVPTR